MGGRGPALGARSAAMPCASRATTSRREISMSLRGARGRGAAAARRLDDAHGIACGAAPNIAPSSCNPGPSHLPDRLLSVAGAARQGHGVDAELGQRSLPFVLEVVAEDDALVGGDVQPAIGLDLGVELARPPAGI